ncbi:MAG: type II secretion system protein [Rhodopirellula sp.]|nr:type II secretion system protein [Rhodopirellula sp.]
MKKASTTSAFTLIELLVVIAILALLVSILMPSLARARDMAKTVVCATNLKAIGTVLASYTNEYNGSYPAYDFYMVYLDDETGKPITAQPFVWSRHYLNIFSESYGLGRETFYCPVASEGSRFANSDDNWDWSDTRYRIVSYAAFCNITPALIADPLKGNMPTSIETANPWWVLGADIVYEYPLGTFATPHEDGSVPKGANVLHVDNHVEWKQWADFDLDMYIESTFQKPRVYAW